MIVLTGAAGFIGSCILARLNTVGRTDIIIVDHLADESKNNNLKGKKYKKYLDKKEFIDLVKQNEFKEPVKTIIHMGACSSTVLQDPQYYEENNFEYSRVLAEWALKHKVRLIYASSAATYGDGKCGYSDDDKTLRRLKPLNFYG